MAFASHHFLESIAFRPTLLVLILGGALAIPILATGPGDSGVRVGVHVKLAIV